MFLWLMVILFGYLTLEVSYWFAIGLIFFSLLKAYSWYRYNGRPWRKIHYKSMVIYAEAAGREMAMAKAKNVEFNLRKALISFTEMLSIKGFLPLASPEKIVEREFDRIENFKDRSLIKEHCIKVVFKNSSLENLEGIDVMTEKILNEMQSGIKENYNSLIVRLIIAAAIENIYSSADRGEYLYEYFNGKVN
jgi:hypothetical protein